MSTETISDLSPDGSTRPWILPRPAWQTTARHVVRRVLGSAALTAAVCLATAVALNLIGAGR